MPRIVHLGLGNFHRGHQAVYTQLAGGDWRITGIARSNRALVETLRRQEMRYTVLTINGDHVDAQRVDVVDRAMVAADDPAGVVDAIASPEVAVVTLTITEAGYQDDRPGDRSLLGLLAAGLSRRAGAGGLPISVVSCDNLTDNGQVLSGVMRRIAARTEDSALAGYLDARVAFPATMVDRIVPATTDRHRELARRAGYADQVPVPAEPFRQWVLDDSFAADRPSWHEAGALVTPAVHDWETIKVRLVNGSNSMLAYLGLLRGHALIAAAFADPVVRAAVDALGDEYQPTLPAPDGFDAPAYRAALAGRFGNAALGHRTEQVGADGSLKLRQRVVDTASWYARRSALPSALCLLTAAYLRCLCQPEALAGGPPGDPRAAALAERGRRHPDEHELVRAVLGEDELFGAVLAADTAFQERTGDLLRVLARSGPAAAVRALTP
ncbi:mannitol dehydrogenase family protein [Dactylosporangium fulvum]|uniref:Mannitol-1-phosphate 5-dehydrogenase n=1 Tax=Dactylosporangium fulvum TaxID=53359 RepID=A0ABY5VRR8_9ACTN|nr:mannitol dehydrogenase family protein [Dactylosporangium fulvum]UWP79776.1 mannitol dehydrogenase family protein [Dactylosporangium fulvum]